MPSSPSSVEPFVDPHAAGTAAPTRVGAPATLRALLVAGGLVAAGLAFFGSASVADEAAQSASDPALARLLRGMALLKAGLTLGAAGLLWWRLAEPVSLRLTTVYLLGAWSMAAATALVWQLWMIPVAAFVFHAGEISLLVAAGLDDGALRRFAARRRSDRRLRR